MPEAPIAPRPVKAKKAGPGLPAHLAAAAEMSSLETSDPEISYESPSAPEMTLDPVPAPSLVVPERQFAPVSMREVYEMEDATHRKVIYDALGMTPENVDHVRRQLVAMKHPLAGMRGPQGVLLGTASTSTTVKMSGLEHRCLLLAREAERQQVLPPGVPSPQLFIRAALQKYYALYGAKLEEVVGPAVPSRKTD